MTNEEKRNIYNNIQNLYNMDFTSWQEVLAMMYNLVADVEQKFENFEQRFELMVGKEVTEVINKMYLDGTLASIINEEIFSDLNVKIDKIKNDIMFALTNEVNRVNDEIKSINEQLDTNMKYIEKNSILLDMFDGTTDDEKFAKALNSIKLTGGKILLDNKKEYNFYNDYLIENTCIIEGTVGTAIHKNKTTIVNYKGNGTFLHFKDDGTGICSGVNIKNIIFYGNPNAKYCIKTNEYNNVATAMRGFTLENVGIHEFVNGWGLDLCQSYGNSIINCTISNNGGDIRLKDAHGTNFISGAIENSLFGLSIEGSRPVNFFGTVLEGYVKAQKTQLNGSIPSDLLVWDGWKNDDGVLQVTSIRNSKDDYLGTAIRNIGSLVNCYGAYFELNDYSILCELESKTNVYNSWIENWNGNVCFCDFAHGYINITDNTFSLNDTSNFKAIILNRTVPLKYKFYNNIIPKDNIIGGHGNTGLVRNINISDNYSHILELEKINENTIFVYASNVYSLIGFNNANTPIFNEGKEFTFIYQCHSTACKIKFGNEIIGVPYEYQDVLPGQAYSCKLVYHGGKLYKI